MPFDGKEAQFETPALRRARLIEALRQPMPEGHTWDFDVLLNRHPCGTTGCALGVAKLIFGSDADVTHTEFWGITEAQYGDLFTRDGHTYGVPVDEVTPAMVAEALERI